MANVQPVASTMFPDVPPSAPTTTSDEQSPWQRYRRTVFGTLVVVIALTTAIVVLNQSTDRTEPLTTSMLSSVPFTSFPGREGYPAFSPDGNLVAFTWDGEEEEHYDLYVKQRHADSTLRLTSSPENESYPAWSPEGSTLAFARNTETGGSIHTVPVFGGPTRRLLSVPSDILGLDWSPDGQTLVYAATGSVTQSAKLFTYSLATQETHSLTSPPTADQFDSVPTFSPDGEQVAFVRCDPFGAQDIHLVPTAGGPARQLTHSQRIVTGLTWTRDSQHLVYSGTPLGHYCLWRVSIRDGSQTRLPTHGRYVMRPDIPVRGSGMVYEELSYEYDIWRLRLNEGKHVVLDQEPLISSTLLDKDARFSPDGSHIAFLSSRSGHTEVWLCNSDGSQPRQISNFNGMPVSTPRWSPDGLQLACSSVRDGFHAIYLLDPEGGPSRCVKAAKHNERFSAWSRNGHWLYYATDQGANWQIWKIRPDASDARPVTSNGGKWAKESPDGQTLYYSRPGSPGLWAMPLGEGLRQTSEAEAHLVLETSVMADWSGMVIVDKGIYYILGQDHPAMLYYYDFATGDSKELASIPGYLGYHLSVSADGKYLLYERSERFEQDLVLVEDFR
jgi:Tol biopolymer transport system component